MHRLYIPIIGRTAMPIVMLMAVLTAMLTGVASNAQEADAPAGSGEETPALAAGEGQDEQESEGEPELPGELDDAELDDTDLDLQTYEEDDDDFVPTEEIPADEAIPFPSDI